MINKARPFYPCLPAAVEVIDCTLRDGEQAAGVWFTLEEKLQLAQMLSEAGVAVLDAGFPASSGEDMEAIQEMRRLRLRSRLGATARPLLGDVQAAERSGAHEVFLFMPTSDLRLTQTLGITRGEARRVFRAGAEAVKARGMTLNLVFEDATRTSTRELVETVRAIQPAAPVDRLILADTVGCALPRVMEELVATVRTALDGEIAVCPHCHNDFGLAGANTVAAVAAGATAVTCTVNGIGERAGNADLAETVAALTHLLGVAHGIDPTALAALGAAVERFSGVHTGPLKPVTGSNVFRHESGIHVDGMLKEPRSYEFLPAAWLGRGNEFVLGKHSGAANIRHLLRERGFFADEELVRSLLAECKESAARRSKRGHDRAFTAKSAFAADALSGVDASDLLAGAADSLPALEDTAMYATPTLVT